MSRSRHWKQLLPGSSSNSLAVLCEDLDVMTMSWRRFCAACGQNRRAKWEGERESCQWPEFIAAKRILKAWKQKALNVLEFQIFLCFCRQNAATATSSWSSLDLERFRGLIAPGRLPALENLLEMITNFTQITLSPRQSPFLTFRKNTSWASGQRSKQHFFYS